ncbi:MAG TPA: DUF3168 domain-containing protein [Bacillota bacterium]|nr:DUF3168 domain-containing protein [Bacillota bacterium]
MEIEVAIVKHLLALPGVSALVGNRVFQNGAVPDDTDYPYVSIMLVYGRDEECLSESPNFAEDTFQFSSAGLTRAGANTIAKQVNLALKDFSGVMGGAGGVNIQAVTHDGRHDSTEKQTDGTVLFYRDEDFVFYYERQ